MKRMAHPVWTDDPILDLSRGERWRLVAAYGIAGLALAGFLLLFSLAGF